MKCRRNVWALTAAVLLLNACGALGAGQKEPFQLKVALYPWVPHPESFMNWIEDDFESKNPHIDLVVRPWKRAKQEQFGDLSYDYEKTAEALTTSGADSQHIIEVDTMILGRLIEAGAIQRFEIRGGVSFLPSANEAVTWKDGIYGVPHWTCGYFVMSQLEEVSRSMSLSDLLSVLEESGDEDRVDLVGDLDGSWTSIMIYLDSFTDTYPGGDLGEALNILQLDPRIKNGFHTVGKACTAKGKNYCDKDRVERFADGKADAFIGYSERLHKILHKGKVAERDLHIASATLGEGDHPMLFTDALVLSGSCSDRCKAAASVFAAYYVSDEVFEIVLMGQDIGPLATPRYLLPSTTSAFDVGDVRKDRLYQQLKQEIGGAKSFPNQGVPKAREAGVIRSLVKDALGLHSDEQ